MRDPLYAAIQDALSRPVDPDTFERCAAALLRNLYPTLVHVRGGQDAGMDAIAGFTAGPPMILVATTAQDVLGNLRRNLESHLKRGGGARLAVLATTQSLTPRRRLNLESAAKTAGFRLIQVFEREWFAETLYRDPRWRQELLGLTGDLPAISVIPPSRRPSIRLPLIGREDELKRLCGAKGDLVVVGKPGSGKTAVLRELAEAGWGHFIVDDTDERLVDAVREQRPARLILDDAHFEAERLTRLRHLRDEIGGDFQIVAVTWPGSAENVEAHLGSAAAIEIGPLTRDEILEIVKQVGVRGPEELLRAIVDQARGRPGLAATMALMALSGKAEEVATGEALLQDTRVTYREMLGEPAASVLAVLALAGDTGLHIESVAQALQLDLATTHHILKGLASGGTVDQGQRGTGRLAVQPESLRYALVREAFFGGAASLPVKTVLQVFDDPTIGVVPLVGAAHRGAHVDPQLMRGLVERCRDPNAIAAYASLGESEAAFARSVAPDYSLRIARSVLPRAFRFGCRLLMELAVGDGRPRHSTPDHPMRVLADHLAEPSTPLAHRREVLEVVEAWNHQGRDPDVALEAVCLALGPGHRSISVDPGAGRTFTIREGILSPEALHEVAQLWNRAVDLIGARPCANYQPLFDVLHGWLYPRTIALGAPPAERIQRFMRRQVATVIRDLAGRLASHRGVVSRLARLAKQERLSVKVHTDEEFEILFPPERIKDARRWRAAEQQQIAAAHKLAEAMTHVPPGQAVERIVSAEREAAEAGINYPRMTLAACNRLAQLTAQPDRYLRAFSDFDGQADLVMPFLVSLTRTRPRGWARLITAFLKDHRYWRAAVGACLTEPVGATLRAEAVRLCNGTLANYLESLVIREELDEDAIARLLEHPDCAVARPVAIQVCLRLMRSLPERLLRKWENAIIRCPADDTWYAQIMSSRPGLLERWVHAWLARQDSKGFPYERIPGTLLEVIAKLPIKARRRLLEHVPPSPANPDTGDLIRGLVADDDELIEVLFSTPQLRSYQGGALAGRPTDSWLRRAYVALDHGWQPEEIVAACMFAPMGWIGSEAAFWDEWVEDFRNLARVRDRRAKLLSEGGVRHYGSLRDRARQRERHEAIYGLS